MTEFDAILVPGGGVQPDGEPPPWARERLDRAIERYRGEFIITLSFGTVHKPPPVDQRGFPLIESACAANYLIRNHIPSDRVLFEAASYDTIGNAYFSRVIHTDPRELFTLLVITSEFHMPRTRFIFDWIFNLSTDRYRLSYESVPDVGLSEDALMARREKEQRGLESACSTSCRITSLKAMHEWLFASHEAYLPERPQADIGNAYASY